MKPPAILIVEDEAIIARDIRQQLGELGYEVAGETATGEEAIVLEAELNPDLVLMDIHLAGKIDGIDAAQTIRKRHGTPVVFLTAFASPETLDRARRSEPFGYIIKPFDERYLHTVIEMALYKHRAETDLRRAYDEHATVLRTALDGFFMADWQGRLLEVNESSCKMLGYTREELLTMSLSDFDAAPGRPRIAGIEGLKQPEPAQFERRQKRKDGSSLIVEMSVNYLPHQGGRIFCFARDITARKTAEESLLKANQELETRVATRTQALDEARKEAETANRAKAAFLATMTHELRTPLNGVIGIVDILRQTSLDRDQAEMLGVASESASSLLGIVDDILDFSKIEAGRLGVESLPMKVEEVMELTCALVSPLADKEGVELTMFTDPKITSPVLGDAVRLKQVLLNLANNAVKFSSRQERRGRVSVRALSTGQTKGDATVLFEIKDNGIGMDATTRAQLFQSFTQGDASITRRFGGSGLGLAISQNLAELMGGAISVTSELNEGSVFRLVLSFPLPTHQVAAKPPISELAGLPCLVVGGPEGVHADLTAYLEAEGAAVEHVADLASARLSVPSDPHGPRVWIFDIYGDPPSLDALRAAAREKTDQDTRFVLVGRGRRRKPRVFAPSVIVVDANAMTRGTFLNAVASAAGLRDMTNTTPISVQRRSQSPPSREEAKRRCQLVLVAEDNEINQKVISRQLGLLGYAADIVSGGEEALRRWQSGDYALLLSDLHMPALDGYQLAAAIRSQESSQRHAVIIALTADVLKGGAQQCRDAGMDDYLCKPARLAEVRAMLEKWLPLDGPAHDRSTAPAVKDDVLPPARPVDIAVLENLVGRDPDVIREFLRAFWMSTAKTSSELVEAWQNKDTALVANLAHKFKSPARSVGAGRLALLCDELEQAALALDIERVETSLPLFKSECAHVEEYLRGI